MTFPNAHSTVYRNEIGEVLGWDNTYYDDEPYDPAVDDYYDPDPADVPLRKHETDADENWCYTCDEQLDSALLHSVVAGLI